MNSVKDTAAYPHHIEDLRIRLMNQLFSLLESQSRTRSFASSISTLVKRLHGKGLEEFERGLARIDDPLTVEMFRNAITDFRNLDLAFDKLVDERQRQWYKNGKYLKQVIDELTETTDYLASILVEKSLLERQSQVLENIILSHEKVSQWKEFVQEILAGFHKIFPFNFFFIAFAEEH